MADTWINSDIMLLAMKEKMSAEMMEAAEPVIRKAVEEAEKAMRRRLGQMFVALLDEHFSMERHGTELRIVVKHERSVG